MGSGIAWISRGDIRQAALALLFGMAVLVASLVATALGAGGPGGVLAGAGLVCLAGAPLVLRLRTDRLDAPGLYGAMAVFTFGVASLAWLGEAPGPGPGIDQATVAKALVLIAGGLAAFAIGARVVAGAAKAPSRQPRITECPAWQMLAVAYAVAAGVILLGLALDAYGYRATDAGTERLGPLAGAVPFVAGQATVVILATAVAWLHTGNVALRRTLVGMLAVQVPLGFVVGVKGESVIPLALVALAVVATGRSLPWKWIGGGIAVVLLVLIPANGAYRNASRADGDRSMLEAIRAVASPGDYRPDRTARAAGTYVFTRLRYADNVALIQRDTPSVYRYGDGSTYYLLPLIVAVPRPLWDGKPVLDTGAQFARTYWEIPPSIRTSQTLTQPGDLYRNFAWPGVIAGLLLWGAAIGFWQRLRRRYVSPRMTLIYLWSLPAAVLYMESDFPSMIAPFAKTLPIVAAVAWLLLPGAATPPGYQVLRRRVQALRRLGRA